MIQSPDMILKLLVLTIILNFKAISKKSVKYINNVHFCHLARKNYKWYNFILLFWKQAFSCINEKVNCTYPSTLS